MNTIVARHSYALAIFSYPGKHHDALWPGVHTLREAEKVLQFCMHARKRGEDEHYSTPVKLGQMLNPMCRRTWDQYMRNGRMNAFLQPTMGSLMVVPSRHTRSTTNTKGMNMTVRKHLKRNMGICRPKTVKCYTPASATVRIVCK